MARCQAAGTARAPGPRASRLVREHAGDYPTRWAAIQALSCRLGMSTETLRKWVRQAEVIIVATSMCHHRAGRFV